MVRLDFTNYVTNYTYMNAAAKFCRDFLFRVCPIAGS